MHPSDVESLGWFVLQHHDPDKEPWERRALGAVRLHEPEDEYPNNYDPRFTMGDVSGGLYFEANKGRNKYNTWFMTGAPVSYDPGEEGTRERGADVAGPGWLPMLDADTVDKRFNPIAADDPVPEFARPWVTPKGLPALMSAGTQEKSQEPIIHPSFYGIIAPNRNPPAEAGTWWFDLDASGAPKARARAQSLFSVEELNPSLCGVGGDVIALHLGASPLGGDSGHLVMVDYQSSSGALEALPEPEPEEDLDTGQTRERPRTQTAEDDTNEATETRPPSPKSLGVASSAGGGPLWTGGLADQHRLGTTKDGAPIHSIHIPTNALFKGLGGDSPLAFELGIYPNPDKQPLQTRVHLVQNPSAGHPWCGGTKQGYWQWYAESFMYADEGEDGIEYTKGEDFPLEPIGGGDPGTVTREFPPGTEGSDPEVTPERPITGGSQATLYAAMANCLVAAGGVAFKPSAWNEGEDNLAGSPTITQDDVKKLKETPITGSMTGYGKGDGTWNGWEVDDRTGRRPVSAGGVMFVPPGGDAAEILREGSCSGQKMTVLAPCGKVAIGFGLPNTDTGGLKSGTELIKSGSAVAFNNFDSTGTETAGVITVGDQFCVGNAASTPTSGDAVAGSAKLIPTSTTPYMVTSDGTVHDLSAGGAGSVGSIMTENVGSESNVDYEIVFDSSGNIVLDA